eukprot:TRINITY_DN36806_c0_g2_i1.p1 TRINITY_DN36806_c0_g2~~TRINITY_DN36806_c0_g2_i1.p1  ORF type:complete len:476 (-),score=74.86 TRINITY_DN36806_c0_g2_i1:133-1560(-)
MEDAGLESVEAAVQHQEACFHDFPGFGMPFHPYLGTPASQMMPYPMDYNLGVPAEVMAAHHQPPLYGGFFPMPANAGLAMDGLAIDGAPQASRRKRGGRRRGAKNHTRAEKGFDDVAVVGLKCAAEDGKAATPLEAQSGHVEELSPVMCSSLETQEASSSSRSSSPNSWHLGNPAELVENEHLCSLFKARLSASASLDKAEKQRVIDWLLPVVVKLALTPHGCRLVQDTVVAATGSTQYALLDAFAPYIQELYESPHGNHVLNKTIAVMPSAILDPLISYFEGYSPTGFRRVRIVARHRFGCRILERLMEHCFEEQRRVMVEELTAEAELLCRHPYGNFVVHALLEYGSDHVRMEVVKHLLDSGIGNLAMHRTASHVVQRALDYCNEDLVAAIVKQLLEEPSPHSIVDVAVNRYGSYVAEQLASVNSTPGKYEVAHTFIQHSIALSKTKHGIRVAECFQVPLPHDASGSDFVDLQ